MKNYKGTKKYKDTVVISETKIALCCSQCSHECPSYVGTLSLLKCF